MQNKKMSKFNILKKKLNDFLLFISKIKVIIIFILVINFIVLGFYCYLNLHYYQNVVSNSPGQLIINKFTGNYCIFVPNKSIRNAMVITRNFEICKVDNYERIILP